MDKKRRERIDKRKLWNAKSKEIRAKADNKCIICGRSSKEVTLNVHHIVPRQIHKLEFEDCNLVCLCPKCHKYSYTISAHKNPFSFICWMSENKTEQMEKLAVLYDDYMLRLAAKI